MITLIIRKTKSNGSKPVRNLNGISQNDLFKQGMILYFTNSNNANDTLLLNFHKFKISRVLNIE